MDQYLEPVDSYPETSVPVFRTKYGKMFICKDYNGFCRELAENLLNAHQLHNMYVDWGNYPYQSLIFYIKINGTTENPYFYLQSYFQKTFLNVLEKHLKVPNLTIILSMPRNKIGGMRIHVPHFKISRDDYLLLCNLMKDDCEYRDGPIHIKLDSEDMPLPACDTTVQGSHIPIFSYKVKFPSKKICDKVPISNSGSSPSLFDRLKYNTSAWYEAVYHMMPVPDPNVPIKILHYPTHIRPLCEGKRVVAQFKSLVNDRDYIICKSDVLEISKRQSPFCFEFLKRHAHALDNFWASENSDLLSWYFKFQLQSNYDSTFWTVELHIKSMCLHLRDDPLKRILMNPESVLPVFYALCNLNARKTSDQIAERLSKFHEPVRDILNKVLVIPKASSNLNMITILRCAFETPEGNFLEHIGAGWSWILEHTDSVEEMQMHLKTIQEKHFPIVEYRRKMFAWDPFIREWQLVKNGDIVGLLQTIYEYMKVGFEGFSLMPGALREYLDKTREEGNGIVRDWIVTLANRICNEVPEMKTCNVRPQSLDVMKQYFGRNVPNYFFFPTGNEE